MLCTLNSPKPDCPSYELVKTIGKCQSNSQNIIFTILQPITLKPFRIQTLVNNPSTLATSSIVAIYKSRRAENWFGFTNVQPGSKNPLLLETLYPQIITSLVVQLFWGVNSSEQNEGGIGFLGCPITLYKKAAGGALTVINSISSSILISTNVPSLKELGYLNVFWYPAEVTDIKVLLGSVQSTFPVVSGSRSKVTFSLKQNAVKFTSIDSLTQGSSYKISGKFVLASSITSNTVSCGRIEFYMGNDSDNRLGTSSFKEIPIRSNYEQLDNSATYGNAVTGTANILGKISYNVFHSYLTSEIDLSLVRVGGTTASAAILAIYNKLFENFLGDNNKGRPGVYLRPINSPESDNYGLFVWLHVINDGHICQPQLIGMTTTCFGTSLTTSAVIMLKIIFNNNVVGINESDFKSGVLLVGTIFAVMSGNDIDNAKTTDSTQDYGSTATSKLNFITKTDTYWHATVICKPIEGLSHCNEMASITSGIAPASFSGISFMKTKIRNYPSQYADSYVFDFLLCFKSISWKAWTTGVTSEESFRLTEGSNNFQVNLPTLATKTVATGPSLLNAYVIQGFVSNYKSLASLANYYSDFTSNTGTAAFFATYLRVHAVFAQNDITSTVNEVAIFFDGVPITASDPDNIYKSLQKFANADGDAMVANHMAFSQVPAQIIQGYDESSDTGFRFHNDLWHMKSGFKYSTSFLASNAELNVFCPMSTSVKKLESLHIVVYGASFLSTSPILAIFRVLGSAYKNIKKILPYYSSNKNLDAANIAGGTTTNFPEDFKATSFTSAWSADTTSGGNGCYLLGENSLSGIKLKNGGTFKPGKKYENQVELENAVPHSTSSRCGTNKANDLVSSLSEGTDFESGIGTKIGGLFTVYFREPTLLFSSSPSKCTTLLLSFPSSSSSTYSSFYSLLCPSDSLEQLNRPTIPLFSTPNYWGVSYPISSTLQYIWSNPSGAGVYVGKETTNTLDWRETSCVAAGVTGLARETKEIEYYLKLTNTLKYELEEGGVLSVKETWKEESGLKFVGCGVAGDNSWGCTVNSGEFILSNIGKGVKIVNEINILIVADSGSAISTSHYARIFYKGVEVESCSVNTPAMFVVDGSQSLSVISFGTKSDFKYTNMKGARGAFYFTFRYYKTIRSNNYFVLNLGFFAYPSALNKRFRCVILGIGDQPSNNFGSLTTSDLNNMKLSVKNDINGGGVFKIKCMGGQTTDYSMNTNVPISLSYMRAGGLIEIAANDNKISSGLIPPEHLGLSSALLRKTFKTKGFEAEYQIEFLPSSTNITYSGRIIVEFPKCIPPKLNSAGVFSCYLDEIPAFCESTDERRVSIWPTKVLSTNNEKPYVLRITGVTQPNTAEVEENPQVYLALDSNDNVYDGIAEQIFIADSFDASIIYPIPLYVHDLTVSSNVIRSSASISIKITFPPSSIVEGNYIFVQLPASLENSLFYNPYSPFPSCSMKRLDSSLPLELVKVCNLLRGRRFIFQISPDKDNYLPLSYIITLNNLITPQDIPFFFREDVKVFISPDNLTVTHSTCLGHRNSSNFIKWNVDSTSALLNWKLDKDQYFEVNIGHYSNSLGVISTNLFTKNFNWEFNAGNLTNFRTQQIGKESNLFVIKSGWTESRFYIAGTETSVPGKYYLSAKKIGDDSNYYSPMPFLNIKLMKSVCEIKPSITNVQVPIGGYSTPIILNFQSCIPINDVTATANFSSSGAGLAFKNGLNIYSQTLLFENFEKNYQIYFYLYSASSSSSSSSGSVSFSLSGTDAYFYSISSTVSVATVNPNLDSPIFENPVVNPAVGNTYFSFICSQIGIVYYVVGIGKSIDTITLENIKVLTEDLQIFKTSIDPNDRDYKIFGYLAYSQANVNVQVSMANSIKAGENYTVQAFFINQIYMRANNTPMIRFKQPDNLGKTLMIELKFKGNSLTRWQKMKMACLMAGFFVLQEERILTDEGHSCKLLGRVLQMEIIPISGYQEKTYSYIWVVNRDYLGSSDRAYYVVEGRMREYGFLQDFNRFVGGNQNLTEPIAQIDSASNFVWESSQIAIQVTAGNEVVGENFIGLNLTVMGLNRGYIYIGIANNSNNSAIFPSARQLRMGVDGNGNSLIERKYEAFQNVNNNSVNVLFNFTNLDGSKYYMLFWMASDLDTSVNGAVSDIGKKGVATSFLKATSEGKIGKMVTDILMITIIIYLSL